MDEYRESEHVGALGAIRRAEVLANELRREVLGLGHFAPVRLVSTADLH